MIIEDTIDFVLGLDAMSMLGYFWPFFVFDLVRYILVDIIIVAWFIPARVRGRWRRARARRELYRRRPLVSVLVPGKNEGRHIPQLVETLNRQTYKHIEFIVVDDGSDDDTPVICRRLEREGKIDRFIRNDVRGGKASAANTALHYSHGEYIVHLDADSHLAFDAIETIILPFILDPSIGAVGGDVRVANTDESLATRTQAIEYMKSLTTGRTVSSMLGILRIISGAHGAFRRDVLERLGGWDVGPGLDGDLSIKIRKLGLDIVHEPYAVCYTHVPDTFRKLAKQRYRWDRSLVRFRMRKHRDILMPTGNFRLSNFFSVAENIFFNFLLNIKWWIYITQVILFNADVLEYILIINYFLYTMANFLEFFIATVLYGPTMRGRDWQQVLFVPLMPAYTGLYLRTVRTFAYIMELLHGASYRDRWNPWKVSSVARRERL